MMSDHRKKYYKEFKQKAVDPTKPRFPFLTGLKVGITGPGDTQLWGIKQSKSLRK
jgi:hypothetical protein